MLSAKICFLSFTLLNVLPVSVYGFKYRMHFFASNRTQIECCCCLFDDVNLAAKKATSTHGVSGLKE